jgi:hypothetical protein
MYEYFLLQRHDKEFVDLLYCRVEPKVKYRMRICFPTAIEVFTST